MADVSMIVEEAYRVNIYLDTNILVDYVGKKFPLLNRSIDYLAQCPFVKLRSSHYVLFEFTEVRKANLLWKMADPAETQPFDSKVKSTIKKEWKYNGVEYETLKGGITNTVMAELDYFRNNLGIDFDEHVLHENLVYPTSSLCLATKISREDCLVMVSCMHPDEELKLDHCLLLTRDAQYYKAVQENDADVKKVFEDNELEAPILIRTECLQDENSGTQYNLYNDTAGTNIEEFWKGLILSNIKRDVSSQYVGQTYSFGAEGVAAECIYFEMDGDDKTLQNSTGLYFIGRDLTFRTIIAGPFEYWNNGNEVSLPHSNPDFPKYSFRKEGLSPDVLAKLRVKGNLVFYNND